jgi:chromosome segregation ATPase
MKGDNNMKDWNEEVERLQIEKRNEEKNKRLELLSDEINELADLETQYENAGHELARCKQTFTEISDRNSPEIEEATLKLSKIKAAVNEIDIDWKMQELVKNNAQSAVVRQQLSVDDLAARKDTGTLEYAEFMAATQNLRELEQIRDTEEQKLKDVAARYYELKSIPDYAVLTNRIRVLSDEKWEAHEKFAPIERDMRQMQRRLTSLRSVIAKAEAG